MAKITKEMQEFFDNEPEETEEEAKAFFLMQLQNERFKAEMARDIHNMVPSENIVLMDELAE